MGTNYDPDNCIMTECVKIRMNELLYRSRGGSCFEYVAARDLIQDGVKLMVCAGKKDQIMKAGGVDEHTGERGRCRRKLPHGYQKVGWLQVIVGGGRACAGSAMHGYDDSPTRSGGK